jgi:hypothetical protein
MKRDILQELSAAARQYLIQEYPPGSFIPCAKEQYDFFKKTYTPPGASLQRAPAALPEIAIKPPLVKKEPLAPPKVTPAPLVAAPAPTPIKQTAHPKAYILNAMPRSKLEVTVPHLVDVTAKLPAVKEPPESPTFEVKAPDAIMVSFAAPGSELYSFIEKMNGAVNDRLGKRSLWFDATFEALCSLITYAASGGLKAVILVGDIGQMTDWLSPLSELEEENSHVGPLHKRSSLHGVPLYFLALSDVPNQQDKALLWKALQQIL